MLNKLSSIFLACESYLCNFLRIKSIIIIIIIIIIIKKIENDKKKKVMYNWQKSDLILFQFDSLFYDDCTIALFSSFDNFNNKKFYFKSDILTKEILIDNYPNIRKLLNDYNYHP